MSLTKLIVSSMIMSETIDAKKKAKCPFGFGSSSDEPELA